MDSRLPQLRVKTKSLAAEAKIIRQDEKKYFRRNTPNSTFFGLSLRHHRTGVVRHAARIALLAFALLRGVAYLRVENKTSVAPDLAEVRKMADRFGPCWAPPDGMQVLERLTTHKAAADAWVFAAKAHLESQGFVFEEPKKAAS